MLKEAVVDLCPEADIRPCEPVRVEAAAAMGIQINGHHEIKIFLMEIK